VKIIKPYFEILSCPDGEDVLKTIEMAGRTCYKSEDKITADSAKVFVSKLIDRGHESVLEHVSISVRLVCDRGVSHELVRHRLASFSQESTRYCTYDGKGRHQELTFIEPWFFVGSRENMGCWLMAMREIETVYLSLLRLGAKPEEARTVLPNSLKTELVMTANLREWRHIFRLRTSKAAHPQMREMMVPLLQELKARVHVVFDDIAEVIVPMRHEPHGVDRDGTA
jgi:thymidylate synthase (FAD)